MHLASGENIQESLNVIWVMFQEIRSLPSYLKLISIGYIIIGSHSHCFPHSFIDIFSLSSGVYVAVKKSEVRQNFSSLWIDNMSSFLNM